MTIKKRPQSAGGMQRAAASAMPSARAAWLLCVSAAVMMFATAPPMASACSDLILPANASIYPNTVSARTLDLPPQPALNWTVVAAPAGTPFIYHSVGPGCGRAPLSGKPSKYGFQCIAAGREVVASFASRTCPVGSAARQPSKLADFYVGICSDGLNDAGLSAAMLIDTDAGALPLTPSGSAPALYEFDLNTFVLANFATVREAKAFLQPEAGKVQLVRGGIVRDALTEIGGAMAAWTFHHVVHDAKGESLVIEFRNGGWELHDNPLGVLTNAPGLPVQLASLAKWRSARVAEFGGALGSLMTPGNCAAEQAAQSKAAGKPRQCSALARFATLAQNKEALFTRPWAEAGPVTPEGAAGNPDPNFGALAAASRLLNPVILPGSWPENAAQKAAGGTVWFNGDDQTLWAVLRDHTNRDLYVQTASAPRWVKLPLRRVLAGAPRVVRARALGDVVKPVMSEWALDGTAAMRAAPLRRRRQ